MIAGAEPGNRSTQQNSAYDRCDREALLETAGLRAFSALRPPLFD